MGVKKLLVFLGLHVIVADVLGMIYFFGFPTGNMKVSI